MPKRRPAGGVKQRNPHQRRKKSLIERIRARQDERYIPLKGGTALPVSERLVALQLRVQALMSRSKPPKLPDDDDPDILSTDARLKAILAVCWAEVEHDEIIIDD